MTGERFTLNDMERSTPLWQRLRAHLADELRQLRAKNDSTTLDERTTAHLRGQITAVRKLLALDEAKGGGD